jgi:PPM family protein phosphatase
MAAGPSFRFGAATDVGQVRSVNQDSWMAKPDQAIYVVADGMGGHQGGEVASTMAVEIIGDEYRAAGSDALVAALRRANDLIHDRGERDPGLRGMGTTAVVAAVVDGDEGDASQVVIANIGDSRAYLYRAGELEQLTDDHSMVADLVRQGRLSPEEAENHPQRNIVTRVLGVYEDIDVDLFPVDVARGDRFLLCSDGLFNEVGEEQIAAVLRRLDDPADAADELVRLANDSGGRDNITVLVLDATDDAGAAKAASTSIGGSAAAGTSKDERDLAGFTSAVPAPAEPTVQHSATVPAPSEPGSRKMSRRERRATGQGSRFTWRVALFLVVLLAVLGGAYATVVWYGTSAYFVAFDDDDVAIFKGRPGGLLWIDPELEERTPISRDVVPEQYLDALEDGQEYSTLAGAEAFIANLTEQGGIDPDTGEVTTTTRPRQTTTTTRPRQTTTTTRPRQTTTTQANG